MIVQVIKVSAFLSATHCYKTQCWWSPKKGNFCLQLCKPHCSRLRAAVHRFVVWDIRSIIQNVRTTILERTLIKWGMSLGPVQNLFTSALLSVWKTKNKQNSSSEIWNLQYQQKANTEKTLQKSCQLLGSSTSWRINPSTNSFNPKAHKDWQSGAELYFTWWQN